MSSLGSRSRLSHIIIGLVLAAGAESLAAQEIYSGRFGQQSGEDLYRGICQGCHMPDGKGATGAGTYPSLAHDAKLAAAVYPITVVSNGQRAMPSFGEPHPPFPAYLNDQQIANVLNYVRTHFGNHFTDVITATQVQGVHRTSTSVPPDAPANTNAVSH